MGEAAEEQGQNRRFRFGKFWLVLISLGYYAAIAFPAGATLFVEYAKDITLGLGVIVGGLTITDAVFTARK